MHKTTYRAKILTGHAECPYFISLQDHLHIQDIMFFTGYLSVTGSYSVSLPWSGGAYWELLGPTSKIFALTPWAPEVAVPSDQWNGVFFVPFAPTSTRQARAFSVIGPSVWNGLRLAHWHCDCSPGFTTTHSTLTLKLLLLAML